MTGALERTVWSVARRQNIRLGMDFVGAVELPRPRHGHGMAPERAPLGNQEMIVAAVLLQMRPFGEADRRAPENEPPPADQL